MMEWTAEEQAFGYELLTEPALRIAAKEELKQRLGGRKYQAVQNMDLTELLTSSSRYQRGMNDEYVNGAALR